MEDVHKRIRVNAFDAFQLAINQWQREVSDGMPMEDGDSFVAVFGNSCLIVSMEQKQLRMEFLGDLPVMVDADVDVYRD